MISRSMLIIAPVIALAAAACTTGADDSDGNTDSTSQAVTGYANPGDPPPGTVSDNSWSCTCENRGPHGLGLAVRQETSKFGGTQWVCKEMDKCCPPGVSCPPSGYTSSYNPCTYAWNGPYQKCNSSGYCFCTSWPY